MEAYLVLENGRKFRGKRFGAGGDVIAEMTFTTGMTGYLENLTNKSFSGQIIVQTFPLIGNYGVIPSDFEGDQIGPCGYIVKEWCQTPSNFRSEGDLDTFFVSKNVVGLSGIDTRALTKVIRDAGTLNGCITNDPDSVDLEQLRKHKATGLVEKVSTEKAYTVEATGAAKFNIALLDCGLKKSIITELTARGCKVTVWPFDTKAETILETKPNGIVLSNGPGNPSEIPAVVEQVKLLSASGIPMFGICLGHLLLAKAHGFAITTLQQAHRGGNVPVRDVETKLLHITSQGHAYTVTRESIDAKIAKIRFENVTDLSCEGLQYVDKPAMSVQFFPEASPGPLDARFLFNEFISMMEGV